MATTVLALDLGNSRLKWGIAVDRSWQSLGVIPNDQLSTLMVSDWKHLPVPQKIIGANVAGDSARVRVENLMARWHVPPQWLKPTRECCDVTNMYAHPEQLGADRWAALLALRQKQLSLPRCGCGVPPCLHVSFGTAVVIDALDSDGTYLGGVILPSVSVMRQSLASSTAQLSLQLPVGRYSEYPRCTEDGIFSGSLEAIIGLVERWRARLAKRRRIVDEEVMIFAGGGDATSLGHFLPQPFMLVENTVLNGLYIAMEQGDPLSWSVTLSLTRTK